MNTDLVNVYTTSVLVMTIQNICCEKCIQLQLFWYNLLLILYNVCRFVIPRLTICIFCHDRGIPEHVFSQFPGQMPNTDNVHPHMMGQTGGIQVPSYN